MELLARDEFRNKVFERDNYKCVICNEKVDDAHHIIERKLWDDYGYYLDNGVSLCNKCHIKAEKTLLSCDELREKANIENILLPPYLYRDNKYDKWGNIILPSGMRLKGDLFFDENTQKILKSANVLNLFSKYVKYPRTYHLPWSESISKDDRVLNNVNNFINKQVVVTIKMDGENSSIYNDYFHARSIDSINHESRNYVKNLVSKIQYDIPNEWRICGENIFAKHTIEYNNLESYLLIFSIWNEKNICLNWKETKEWCELLNLKTVPVLFTGIFDEGYIKYLYKNFKLENKDETEGYVIRLYDEFSYRNFRNSVAKFVDKKFSRDLENRHYWMNKKIIQNKLKGDK